MMNEDKKVMNALVNLMVCPRCPGCPSCMRCSYTGTDSCYESLIDDSMSVLNRHFGAKAEVTTATDLVLDYEVQIVDALREIGIPAGLLGYRYVAKAITFAISNIEYIDAMTSVMYPTIAKEFGTTATRVERAIRHAIEVAWDRGDPNVLYGYFGNSVCSHRGKPTNTEFIATIAECIKQCNHGIFSK